MKTDRAKFRAKRFRQANAALENPGWGWGGGWQEFPSRRAEAYSPGPWLPVDTKRDSQDLTTEVGEGYTQRHFCQ